jgi:hypothetical protein
MAEPSRSNPVKQLLIPLRLPFVQILQAMLHRASIESAPNLSTILQDRAELHFWARLANRRDQVEGPGARVTMRPSRWIVRPVTFSPIQHFHLSCHAPVPDAVGKFNAHERALP